MSCVLDNIRRFDLALSGIDRTMRLNERRKGDIWRRRTPGYHLRHAFFHLIFHYLRIGHEPHLNHAATRLLMALQLEEEISNRI